MHYTLSAVDAARKIREGQISSVDLVKSCLHRIEETDGKVKAWAHLEPEYALAQAEKLDAIRKAGRPIGPLHGIPVGLKDIVDTKDQPTQRGSSIFAGRWKADQKGSRKSSISQNDCWGSWRYYRSAVDIYQRTPCA